MRRWQMAQQGLKGLFLVALILVGCEAPGGDNPQEGCGGTEAVITCIDVTNITPTGRTGDTTNVDARQNVCRDPVTGAVTSIEPFGDHNAQVTLTSRRFPTADSDFDIRIVGFSVTYRLNQCPRAAIGCPPLTGFTVSGQSVFIAAGQTVTVTLPYVPIRVKDEYVAAGGEVGLAAPSYTVVYTFTAQTTRFNDTFTVQGNSEFSITDFNNCT